MKVRSHFRYHNSFLTLMPNFMASQSPLTAVQINRKQDKWTNLLWE